MSTGNSSSRWLSPWRTSAARTDEDPADMGTAFGLDMSLNMLVPEPAPPAAVPRKTWMSRLHLGRKTAA